MIEETVTAAAVCITAAIFSTLLKQYCREHALFCVIGACAAVGIAAAAYLTPVVSQMQALFERTNLPSAYLTILWKALGSCCRGRRRRRKNLPDSWQRRAAQPG